MQIWTPRTREDNLLKMYHQKTKGTIITETPIGSPNGAGNWPAKSKIRRIDGIRIANSYNEFVIIPP